MQQTREDRLCAGCGKLLPEGLGVSPGASAARDLLHRFLDLRSLTPHLGDWSEERLAGNPPRLVRLRRLMTLFRTFGIDWDPAQFTEGKFIDPKSPRYARLLEHLAAQKAASMARRGLRSLSYDLPECFSILLRYREHVETALAFSRGVLEASGLYAYAHAKVEELNRVIRNNVAIIDDILVALICPEAKTPVAGQPPHEYDYPEDYDWW
jgi:hypothetical protein